MDASHSQVIRHRTLARETVAAVQRNLIYTFLCVDVSVAKLYSVWALLARSGRCHSAHKMT